MIGANALHVRFSVGTLSISIRELAKTVKVADLLAEIELKSAVPAQLLELLNPGMEVVPIGAELEFGRDVKNGALLTASIHPGWAQIVDQGVLARWSEVLSISKSMGPEATEICTFLVVKYGSLDDLRKLIERGATVSGRTLFERSTLHFAAYHGRTEFVHLLLGAGVAAGHKDYQGLTAKEYATKNGFYETARWCWLGQFNYGRNGGVMAPKEEKKNSAASSKSEKKVKVKEKSRSSPSKSALPTQKSRKMVVNWLRESSEAIQNVEKTENVAKSDFVRGKNQQSERSSNSRSSSREQKKDNSVKRVQLLAPAGAGESSMEYRKTVFSGKRPPELDEAVRRTRNVDEPVTQSRVSFPDENDVPEKTTKFRKTKFSAGRPEGLDELVDRVKIQKPKSQGVSFATEQQSDDENSEKSKFRKTKFSNARPAGLDELVNSISNEVEPKKKKGVSFGSDESEDEEIFEKSSKKFRKTKFSSGRPAGLDELVENIEAVKEPEKGVKFESEESEREESEKAKFRKTKFSFARPEGIEELVEKTKSEDTEAFFLTEATDDSDFEDEEKRRSISFAEEIPVEEDGTRYHKKYRKSVFVSSSTLQESGEEDNSSSTKPLITVKEKLLSGNPTPQISIPTAVEPVDQFIKLETDKIKESENKENSRKLSPEVSFTEENFNQKDWVYRLSFLQSRNNEFILPQTQTPVIGVDQTPAQKQTPAQNQTPAPNVPFRVSVTSASNDSKLLDQRVSVPPTTLQSSRRPTSSGVSSVQRPKTKLIQRAKTSHDLLEEERQKQEAIEKRRSEAEAAYQQWVKTKKNVKLRRLTPSPPRERDLKWYENKKRMFEPGSYSERPRARIQQQAPSRPPPSYSESHKPRKYEGSGIAFEDWLAKKQAEKSAKPQQESKEETKLKNDEMRQMMAEEKFKEWLNKKLEQRQKATAQDDKDNYEAHKRNTTSEKTLSFDVWLQKKNQQQKQLQRVLRQIKRDEQKREEEEIERKQQGLSFEEWMIRKEQAELYGDKVARDMAQQDAAAKLAEIEEKRRMRSQQEQELEEETAESVSAEEREMIEAQANSPEISATPENLEKEPKSIEDVSKIVIDKTETPSPDSPKIPETKPEPEPEPEAVVVIHEVTMGKTTEILENGEHRVSTSENSPQDKFVEVLVEENNQARVDAVSADPFVDDYDSDHSSLASDISYPELLELITNLDSD